MFYMTESVLFEKWLRLTPDIMASTKEMVSSATQPQTLPFPIPFQNVIYWSQV